MIMITGMVVADYASGGGYFTRLFSRSIRT